MTNVLLFTESFPIHCFHGIKIACAGQAVQYYHQLVSIDVVGRE